MWFEGGDQIRLLVNLSSFGYIASYSGYCGSKLAFIVIYMEGLLGAVTNRPYVVASPCTLRYIGRPHDDQKQI
jgi:hypothetical protein